MSFLFISGWIPGSIHLYWHKPPSQSTVTPCDKSHGTDTFSNWFSTATRQSLPGEIPSYLTQSLVSPTTTTTNNQQPTTNNQQPQQDQEDPFKKEKNRFINTVFSMPPLFDWGHVCCCPSVTACDRSPKQLASTWKSVLNERRPLDCRRFVENFPWNKW